MKQLGLKNPMAVPRITKITLNMGVGEALADRKVLESAMGDLAKISGQKPVQCKARSPSRASRCATDVAIGCKVTLRKARMYEFLDRLISVAMPRIRDFRGVSRRAFDGRGNYNLGVKEQIIFPEINFDQVDAIRGLDISITTTAMTTSRPGVARGLQVSAAGLRSLSHGQEIHADASAPQREKAVEALRRETRRAQGVHSQSEDLKRRGQGRRQQKLAEAAARRVPDSAAQSLRADGAPARLLSQVRPRAHKLREATMRGEIPGLRKASW